MNFLARALKRQTNYENPKSLGAKMRRRRLRLVCELIEDVHRKRGEVKILDVGGRRTYWSYLPESYFREHGVQVTVLNLPSEISNAEDTDWLTHQTGDACAMPEFGNGHFDIIHSNSVIEHVGNWSKIKAFARETRRVGHQLYVQTPYFWFPVEPHYIAPFFHWLPRPIQLWIFQRMTLGNRGRARDLDHAAELMDDAPRLLDMRTFRHLYPDCRIVRERWMLMTKSLIAVRGDQRVGSSSPESSRRGDASRSSAAAEVLLVSPHTNEIPSGAPGNLQALGVCGRDKRS